MKRKIVQIIFLFLFLSAAGFARAAAVEDFSLVTVPVASQSAVDLHPALVSAFTQALVKISGNNNIAAVPLIKKQLPSVERFVQEYRYSDSTLQVQFNRRALVTLLTEAGQPVWPLNRPTVLVLVKGGPESVSSSVEAGAARRGIPIMVSAPDAADSAVAQDQATLEKTGESHHAAAVLSGNLTQAPDESWLGEWFLVWRHQTWQWRSEGANPEEIIQAGMDKMADLLASKLAVRLDQQAMNNLWLAVMDVNDLSDYAQVLHTVKQLPTVMLVTVQDVGSHGVLLRVMTSSEGDKTLKEGLFASQHFTPVINNAAGAADVLNYRWVP